MNPIVLSLTYLILLRLLRVARIPLPPVVRAWSGFSIDELVDLHEVLARAVSSHPVFYIFATISEA